MKHIKTAETRNSKKKFTQEGSQNFIETMNTFRYGK